MNMDEIAKKIHDRRLELNLTLEDVGQAVGVGKSTVRKWENGMIKNMGRDKIAALARVLQMDPVDLVPLGNITDRVALTFQKATDKVKRMQELSKASDGMIHEDDWIYLEALHQDPELRMLFDRVRKMSPEDKKKMFQISGIIKGELYGDE